MYTRRIHLPTAFAAVVVVSLLLAGCTVPATPAGTVAPTPRSAATQPLPTATRAPTPVVATTPAPTAPASGAGAPTLQQVILAPDSFMGRELTLDGTLRAEGMMPNSRFYLTDESGGRLEVTAWLPLEVMQGPGGNVTVPASMATVIDKRLRAIGTLDRGPRGPLFKVTRAQP